MRPRSAGSPVRSCSRDQRVRKKASASPGGEVDGGARDEERHVQVAALEPQHRVGLHHVGVRPLVEVVRARTAAGRTAPPCSGRVPAPASRSRRIATPQPPPVRWWIITTARQPSARPSQKTNATQVRAEELGRVRRTRPPAGRARRGPPRRAPRVAGRSSSGIGGVVHVRYLPVPGASLFRSSGGTSASVAFCARLQRADVGDDRPAVARPGSARGSRASRRSRWSSRRRSGRPAPARSRSMWNDGGCR